MAGGETGGHHWFSNWCHYLPIVLYPMLPRMMVLSPIHSLVPHILLSPWIPTIENSVLFSLARLGLRVICYLLLYWCTQAYDISAIYTMRVKFCSGTRPKPVFS